MTHSRPKTLTAILVSTALLRSVISAADAPSPGNAMYRHPALSDTHIVFTHAGDLWTVPKAGGVATHLTSAKGEETNPRFSPDGRTIAFTANYDGSEDVHTIPANGGAPRRITFHGGADRLLQWFPDGRSLLFASKRDSFTERVSRFHQIGATGGPAIRLPIPYGEWACPSPDGKKIAYTMTNTDPATSSGTWKRYRGGLAPDVWIFDLENSSATNLTDNPANDSQPLWSQNGKLYFTSDRDDTKRVNLWSYDFASETFAQITHFKDYDLHTPTLFKDEIAFEYAGQICLLDLKTTRHRVVPIQIVSDERQTRPQTVPLAKQVRSASISPSGKRVVVEARGRLFTVPSESGIPRAFASPEADPSACRMPAWAPDGKSIAYFTDRSGEYELAIRPADGSGKEQILTKLGPGWRYRPQWSPDSSKIVFIDASMTVHLYELDSKRLHQVDHLMWHYQGMLDRFEVSWSPDSAWFTYATDTANRQNAICLYNTLAHQHHRVTSAFHDDDLPVFDPNGKYLYYRSKRQFRATRSEFDNSWAYTNSHSLIAVPLRRDIPSPYLPKNDEEPVKSTKAADPKPKSETSLGFDNENAPTPTVADPSPTPPQPQTKPATTQSPAPSPSPESKPTPKKEPLRIDIEGFESRSIVLPVGSGKIDQLAATTGRVYFRNLPRSGSGGNPVLWAYEIEARAERKILEDVGGYEISAESKRILFTRNGTWMTAALTPDGAKGERNLPLEGVEATIHPKTEWKQIFSDAWRIERDFFYDPSLHGVDWPAMKERYGRLIEACTTRNDVNIVLGELLGELNSSHTYRSGGDLEEASRRNVGYLGCDYRFEQNAYRIVGVPVTAPWDSIRSPLLEQGLNVRPGDWILAVNGVPIDPKKEIHAAFQGLADRTVLLSVNDRPSLEGARSVLVKPLATESKLRHLAWVERNRRHVEKESNGRIAYIYVANTGEEGQNELYRQWRGQTHKQGFIIDERWNAGGQIPDRFIELLNRPVTHYWGVRDGADWSNPFVAAQGPKVMLANRWSGSGGDCFPWLFRKHGLGKVIGTRTWGGLIGMTGCPPLVDGGTITVPTFGIFEPEKGWIIEGEGVSPDIEVLDDPASLAKGIDPQLERALIEINLQLATKPQEPIRKPAYPNRAR
jgi:tricorn protease